MGARSDIGPRRKDNQDSGFAADHLAVVADGVAGGPAGGLASALAVRTLARSLADLTDCSEAVLRHLMARTNARLSLEVRGDPELRGMATTLTGLFVAADRGYVLHVGDSRAYRWRAGDLHQLTTDQSWIQMLLDEGQISPSEARQHPMRNMLLHSLSGSLADPEAVQIIPVDLRIGDRWLVATDGLTSYLPVEIMRGLIEEIDEPQELAEALVDRSWSRSRDNITVVVADVTAGEPGRRGRFIGAAEGPAREARCAV